MKRIKEIGCRLFQWVRTAVQKYPRAGLLLVGGIAVLLAGALIAKGTAGGRHDQVGEQQVAQVPEPTAKPKQKETTPAGFMGVIEGVMTAKAANGNYYALGTNVEDVLVGQRTAQREHTMIGDMSKQMELSVNNIGEHSWELVEQTCISDKDYETLLAIVEAEAGGEDLTGRLLVANVILNRVNDEQFPDNVTEVVWQKSGGSPQFTPTVDGRIQTIVVSDTTREAVNRAIDGEDKSQGALFFLERNYSDAKNIEWFDSSLNYLFKHGVHSFYKY